MAGTHEFSDSLHRLVARAQAGDTDATAELIGMFEPLLKKVASRYWNVSYEDAFQEACISFLEGLKRFDAARGVPFPGYIQRKVLGDVRSAMRRVWRTDERKATLETAASDENEVDPWNVIALKCPVAETKFDDALTRLWVNGVKLSERERLAVDALLQGMTCSEVAAMENVGTESVKTWRRRAFKKIRDFLEQDHA